MVLVYFSHGKLVFGVINCNPGYYDELNYNPCVTTAGRGLFHKGITNPVVGTSVLT